MVPGWTKFQHYKDRAPLWIKVYTDLESKDEWRDLTLTERGLLVCIWLEYARADGALTTRSLSARVAQRNLRKSLNSLKEAGFIRLSASRPLAQNLEKEKERPSELRQPRRSPSVGGQPELLGYSEWLATLHKAAM